MGVLLKKFNTIGLTPQNTPGLIKPKKQNLKTSSGLLQTAEQSGLGEEAKNVLAKKGEDPKRIFSGGFVSDIFDTLNALQYGVTGMLKGKTFSEGVKTRQSFSDKDSLGDYGLPGVIAGIVADIAVDPLTYVGGLGILKRIASGIKGLGVVEKISDVAKSSKIGDFLGRKFIYRFGQDPVYRQIAERTERAIAIGVDNVMRIIKPLTKLNPKDQKIIAEFRKAGKLDKLPEELLSKAEGAFSELDRLGQEAVNAGLLKQDVYNQNVGQYIARLYRKYEIPWGLKERIQKFFDPKPNRIDVNRFKQRSDISEEIRMAMGEILEAGYPTAKALIQLTQATERARFFKDVAFKWGKTTTEEGFKKLPETKRLGELSGKAVPIPIYDDIQEIIRSGGNEILKKVVAGFKFGKVILNPATHARNIMSNFLLNSFEGLSPLRIDIYAKAASDMARGGKWTQEAKQVGLGLDTFASREIQDILISPEIGKLGRGIKGMMGKLSNLYQNEEKFAKLSQYIFQRGKGLSPEDAAKIAERATFNYAQVTPFIRRLRESIWGFPFITFTYKSTPQVAKTLLTKPTKISNIGKIKNAIENQSDLTELQKERATEPHWIRDGFYIKLPIKDKYGRSAYFDMTYILPFGDLISGELVGTERAIKRDTGLPASHPEAALRKAPLFGLLKEIGSNQDFFGNKIWKESDSTEKQLGDLMRHLIKTYSPPLIADQIPGGYRADGSKRPSIIQKIIEQRKEQGIESGGLQGRSLSQELLRLVGLKIQPVDLKLQESYSEKERKDALKTMLQEAGVIKKFEIPFIPKK